MTPAIYWMTKFYLLLIFANITMSILPTYQVSKNEKKNMFAGVDMQQCEYMLYLFLNTKYYKSNHGQKKRKPILTG